MKQRLAISLIVGQGVFFLVETAMVHHLGGRIPIIQLALLRATGGVVIAAAIAWRSSASLRTQHITLHLFRGGVALGYLWVLMYSFGTLPFADATALSYMQVAYITVFSALILRESVAPRRWLAATVCVIGALFIAQPSFRSWNVSYFVVLAGTSLNALSFVLNRYAQRHDNEVTTMLYVNLVSATGGLFLIPVFGAPIQIPDATTGFWLSGVFLLGPMGVYLGIVAVKHAETSTLAPYTLVRLVIGVLAGFIVFREAPALVSIFGAILILVSCALTSQRGRTPRVLSAAGCEDP
ncbi:MAG: DMT family transporter [Acidobacteria bacterium]|nr:DMT family transporter [Acidobacteriota bacterium]